MFLGGRVKGEWDAKWSIQKALGKGGLSLGG